MKPVRSFQIKDKFLGLKYSVVAQDKTHYLAIPSTSVKSERVIINKTQAVRIYGKLGT